MAHKHTEQNAKFRGRPFAAGQPRHRLTVKTADKAGARSAYMRRARERLSEDARQMQAEGLLPRARRPFALFVRDAGFGQNMKGAGAAWHDLSATQKEKYRVASAAD